MLHRLLRVIALVTVGALLGALVTVVSLATPITSPLVGSDRAQAAPPPSAFDPGQIISDSVMFDYGAMSLARIQSFLESKVPTCSPTASAPCLKDYRVDVPTIPAVANRCVGTVAAASNQTAAQVIYAVSQACRVNPKVLLVTLQKEQGLVTSTSPTAGKYKIAMGYGCPDTAACNSTYYGFVNQVYWAARAYNAYVKSPSSYTYQKGLEHIQYKPNSSCGTLAVNIRTASTAALYDYTPYVPNAAALANPYGTGDSCSSYGNRNFWNYFNDWFGSPVAGGFVVATADGSTYVLSGSVKYQIPAGRLGILPTLAPLGAVGVVSNAYAAGFPTAGSFGNVVTDASGAPYLLDAGRRYSFADCSQAASLGFPCAGAPTLTPDLLALFPLVGQLASAVTGSGGGLYELGGGVRREVLDSASAAAAGLTITSTSALLDDTLSTVPLGAPITRPDVLVNVRGAGTTVFSTSTDTYSMSAAFVHQTNLAARLGAPAGTLDAASVAQLPRITTFAGLFVEPATGTSFVLTKSGKSIVSNPKSWGGAFVAIDPEFSSRLPATGTRLAAPLFVKDQSSKTVFLLSGHRTRPATTASARKVLAAKVHARTTVTALATDTIATSGSALIKPGTVMKATKKSTTWWFVDGAAKKRPITPDQAKEITGSARATVVASWTINGFTTVKGAAKLGLTAGGVTYLADGGILRPVSASDAKQYGKAFGFGSYDPTTIAALRVGAPIGRAIKSGSTYYQVKNGKKVKISAAAAKKLQASSGKKIQAVHAYVAKRLTTKK